MRSTSEDQNWSHGDREAPVGSKEWADFVRLQLVAMVDHLGEDEESFVGCIEMVREHRAWTLMTKKDGETFRSIEEFCAYKRPWGLGTTWAQLRPHLMSGMAKRGKSTDEIERALQLETVPEPQKPGARPINSPEPKELAGGPINSPEAKELAPQTKSKLRAINRAPDSVKDAYREGRISQTLAAKLGPKNPTPEKAAQVAEIASEVRRMKDRRQVDSFVRDRLGAPAKGAPERAMAIVRRMSQSEVYEFEEQFNQFLAGRQK